MKISRRLILFENLFLKRVHYKKKERPFGNEKQALYPLTTDILFNFAIRKA